MCSKYRDNLRKKHAVFVEFSHVYILCPKNRKNKFKYLEGKILPKPRNHSEIIVLSAIMVASEKQRCNGKAHCENRKEELLAKPAKAGDAKL